MFEINEEILTPTVCYLSSGQPKTAAGFLADVEGARGLVANHGERIALAFHDSYLFCVSLVAVLTNGQKAIILPNNKSGTILDLKTQYDFVMTDSLLERLKPLEPSQDMVFSLDSELVFFTSGSQGVPKKISKRFANLYAEVNTLEESFGSLVDGSIVIGTVSHQHIYGFLFKILWPLFTKKTFFARTLEYPENILETAKKVNAITLISTPAFLKRYYLPEEKIVNCRAVFSSGGVLTYSVADLTHKNFNVWPMEVYGSTESGGLAYRQLDSDEKLWTCFPGVEISITPNEETIASSRFFDAEKLLIGDRVRILDGGVQFLGRSDDVVKIEEKRVSLSEMQGHLLKSGFIGDAAVVDVELHGRQQIGCLVVLSTAGKKCLEDEGEFEVSGKIRAYLSGYFDSVVIPRRFLFFEELPYTAQTKISKSDIRRYFL